MKKKLFALLLALALILSLSASVFAYTVPSDTVVYVTETGSCYHRWGCASLKSVAASYTVAHAVDLGYYGCSHCHASRLTGIHTPVSSTSSGSSGSSSSSSSSSSIHRDPPTAASTGSDTKSRLLDWEDLFFCVGFILFYPTVVLLFKAAAWVINGILDVFEKKPVASKTSTSSKPTQSPKSLLKEKPPAVPAPVSAPMPVPQILGQPAALYTLLSPNLLQSSDYTSALQSFSSWAQTCGFSVHQAFSFSDVCFPDVPLKQRAEFMALLSLCKQADRPFDVLLVQHPYCLSLDPQKLEKIRRSFDDLGVKLFFRYLPPSDTVSSKP